MKKPRPIPIPATAMPRELRRLGLGKAQAPAFSFADDGRGKGVAYGWHQHREHQLLYAFEGAARLEDEEAAWMLPPHRAAWIPAGTRHRTTLAGAVVGSVYFDPKRFPAGRGEAKGIRVFDAPPLLREMVSHVLPWTNRRRKPEEERLASAFFKALALLCGTLRRRSDRAYSLPRIASDRLREAVEAALAETEAEGAPLPAVAKAAGLSERTFRRRFREETGMAWRDYALRARLLGAMERLASPGGKWNVTETALAAGFSSLGAFGKAFAAFTGETPREFRARTGAGGAKS